MVTKIPVDASARVNMREALCVLPVMNRPRMITDIAYNAARNDLSGMKRRYCDMMASFVNAIAKQYSTWQTKRYWSALVAAL